MVEKEDDGIVSSIRISKIDVIVSRSRLRVGPVLLGSINRAEQRIHLSDYSQVNAPPRDYKRSLMVVCHNHSSPMNSKGGIILNYTIDAFRWVIIFCKPINNPTLLRVIQYQGAY